MCVKCLCAQITFKKEIDTIKKKGRKKKKKYAAIKEENVLLKEQVRTLCGLVLTFSQTYSKRIMQVTTLTMQLNQAKQQDSKTAQARTNAKPAHDNTRTRDLELFCSRVFTHLLFVIYFCWLQHHEKVPMNPLLENYVSLKMDPRVKMWDGDDLRKIEEQIREDPENAEAIANLLDRQEHLKKAYRFVARMLRDVPSAIDVWCGVSCCILFVCFSFWRVRVSLFDRPLIATLSFICCIVK